MTKSLDWVVPCVDSCLDTKTLPVKSTTLDEQANETQHLLSDCVPSIIEAIPVFTDLAGKHLKLAIALTNRPYYQDVLTTWDD